MVEDLAPLIVTRRCSVQQRSNLWKWYFKQHAPLCFKAAWRLLAIHVTSCAAERNWAKWGWCYQNARRNRLLIENAEKVVAILVARGQKSEGGVDEVVVLDHMAASESD